MIMIDKLAYSSTIRYKSTAIKSSFAIGTLLICVAARSFIISGMILLVMGCLTVYYSQASFSRYMKMIIAPLTFLILGTIAVAVDIGTEPIGLFNLPIGGRFLVVTETSIIYTLRLIITSLAAVSCLYFLILTTTMLDILSGLRRLHCPWLIVELMMLIYRFIFVLLDVASAITTAQNCRLGNKTMRISIHSMGNMLASLLVIAIHKSSSLYNAMEARCYDGRMKTLEETKPVAIWEVLFVAGFLVGLTIAAVFCYRGGL